ncbi:MAG TPA: amino acid adenylation domain-containing protein [Streptosporangiaceae bacterium]
MDQRDVRQALQRVLSGILLPAAQADPEIPLGATGMSSMAAARFWLEIQDELGVDVPFLWLSAQTTLSGLAARIAGESVASGNRPGITVEHDPVSLLDPFPLTPIQESYLTGSCPELTPDPVGCHQYQEFPLANVDLERLRRAWQRLIDHHDMLRAAVTQDGRQQVSTEAADWPLPVHDLTRARPEQAAASVAGVRRRLSHPSHRPGTWPAFRIEVCLLPDGGGLVHLSMDALFADGHGMALLLAQWADLYHNPGKPLAGPGLSARDCVVAMTRRRSGEEYQRDLAYWLGRLPTVPPGPRFGPPRGENRGGAGFARQPLTGRLGQAQWSAVRERAAESGVSPSSLVLTVFADALARAGARPPFSLVVTTNARSWLPAAADNVVGPFTSSAVVVPDVSGREMVTAAASAIHEQVWAALAHSAVSGIDAVREVRSRGHAVPGALPVVFTSLLGLGPGGRIGTGFAADVSYAVSQTSDVLLDSQIWEQGAELRFRWDCALGQFPAGAMETAFALFVNGLHTLCALSGELESRPLNALQQAYFVARNGGNASHPWNGCQIYKSFHLREVDPVRLASTVLMLTREHDAMRSFLDPNGAVRILAEAPAEWQVPVVDLTGRVDPATVLTAIREELTGRAFPLARWPHFDVRVTVGAGPPTVHCAFDVALFDAPSVHFLCRELMRRYADPQAMPWPAEPLAHSPDGAVQSGMSPEQPSWQSYWEERIASLPAGPVLPGRAGRPLDGMGTGQDERRVRLAGRLPGWRRLAAYAGEHGVTPDALLLAAFMRVLAEELGSHDFAVPVVRWSETGNDARPGEFTRLSWVRGEPPDASLLGTATRICQEIGRDCAADGVSGLGVLRRRIMRERAHRDYAYPVVYSSVVDLSDWPLPAGTSEGPWMSCTPDVSLDCIGTADGDDLCYCWDAIAADFPPGRLAVAFARYGHAVQSLTAGTRAPRPPISTLTRAEYRTVVHEWNATERDFPAHRLAHAMVEDRAREHPDAPAVHCAAGVTTYGELNAEANRIAWRLKESGVGPETVVAVATRRGPAMIAAVLGVLKAGGAYLPVEPSLPGERAARMLARTGASAVLTTSGTTRWAAPDRVTVIEIDRDIRRGGAGDPGEINPPHAARPEHTAYIIFTSGSTGVPKGVAVAHRAVSNLIAWCRREFELGPGDLGLAVTSLGFDLSVFDIFGLLGYGGSLYVVSEDQQKDPAQLLDVLIREPVTFWNSAPSTLAQLAPLLAGVRGAPGTSSLRLVFLSGDYTPLSLPDDVRATFPNAHLVSLGGATEATVWSNYFRIGDIDPQWRSIPYGKPIDNARYYILNASLHPCGVGDEGDLYIAGECLSEGYYAEPAMTADRFLPDPCSVQPGQRMYRTGDRAVYFADGTIGFRGRGDGQVKIRGFRVEVGEVEHRLRQHSGVKEVVVLARPDGTADHKLVAYIVPSSPVHPSIRELREFAAQMLPGYMVPNFATFLDAFPMTANGKLDRDALPWPVAQPVVQPTGQPAPPCARASTPPGPGLDELRDEIAGLFAQLLGGGWVDPAQDIWDQGATSFTLVQVSNALQHRYAHRISVSAVLAEPTVTGIAAHLHSMLGPSDAATRDGATADQPPGAAPAAEPASAAAEPSVDYFSAREREEFKARHWNLRPPSPPGRRLPLEPAEADEELYVRRASRRDFLDAPVPASSFGRLLGLLREAVVDGRSRYLYPSAGGTYGVQVYVHIKPDRVDGTAAGVYYYRPSEHALERLGDGSGIDRSIHFHDNRPLYDIAAFELYLVGQTRAITPLYRESSDRFLAIEAGHIGQLLLTAQAELGIGLCPIGEVYFDRLRPELCADEGHRFLMSLAGGAATHRFATPRLLPDERERHPEVAVVGMSGRYPGADSPEALWQNLSAGIRSIGPAPARHGSPAMNDVPGGFLDSAAEFDGLLFQISPAEARTIDPQLRLALETVWECLENAGHTAASLRRAAPRVGVFAAAMWHDYELVGAEAAQRSGIAAASATASDIPHRISHFFDFVGPSVAVDASCASSLTALHLAMESLRRGECDAAVVVAANLLVHPYHAELLRAWGLRATEATAVAAGAFDAKSAGWLPGEGAGALLLRPAGRAAADGDTIQALIEATWTRHSGRAGRFGTPVVGALAESISEGLAHAGLTPADIGYVECAAGGASVADTAEIEALARVFGGGSRQIPVGTLKHNIGHLEAAAGLSQLTKVILQFRHGKIAPTVPATEPNPLLPWEHLPLRVAGRLEEWAGNQPARALVNAVAAGGAYGHAVLRKPPSPVPAAAGHGPHAVLLSAASPQQLRACARRLRDHPGLPSESFADVAFTLQAGRVHLTHRLAIWCEEPGGLRAGLEAYLDGHAHPDVHTSVPGGSGVTPAMAVRTEREALRSWLAGQDVDWQACWPRPARRVALPTYPFAREPHWIGGASTATPPSLPMSGELALVRRRFAEVSGIPEGRLDPHAPMEQYGLNSALVAALNEALARDFGDIPRTLFFEHQTLAEVARRLSADPVDPADPAGPAGPLSADANLPAEDIAIIGIAGRYPQAENLDEFWRLLEEGRDCITQFPADRRRAGWPVDSMWGAFLDGVEEFDPLFFGITPRDADLMDPQERLFLEVVWEALEDACYPRARLREAHGGRAGVFAATMYSEYPFFGVERSLVAAPVSTGSSVAGIANRVSYFLGLHGPSLTVDTMCSSSLTCVHLALSSLRLGECELAIAGGVNLSLHPNKFIEQARLKMTSSDHRCRAFGAGGDGFAPGEGVGAVLLKPLPAAIAAGDRIHAVIKATAVNHSGKTNGYMVPNPVAQGELIASALARARVPPSGIGYIEAHGTGTKLGDPVEINGLERAFGAADLPPGSCAIGSVKSNIGHLEGAAGIAGLTKAVLSLRHRRLVPTLHTAEPNPAVDWARSPFRLQRTGAGWPQPIIDGRPAPRRAAVSSFGAGGANAHIVVEEYQPPARGRPETTQPQLIVMSANDEERLRALAARLAAHLEPGFPAAAAAEQAPATLEDVAYTLQTGREPLRERFAVVVSNFGELLGALNQLAAGETGPAARGRAPAASEAGVHPFCPVPSDPGRASLTELAGRWVRGGRVDWSRLHPGGRPQLVGLPSYPFARRRHWLPDPAAAVSVYSKLWQPAAEAPPPAAAGPAMICLYSTGTEAVAHCLAEIAGERVTLLREGDHSEAGFVDEAGATVAVHAILGHSPQVEGLVDLCDLNRADAETSQWAARLAVWRQLLARRRQLRVLLAVAGLQDLPGPPPSLAGARMAGFLRALDAEYGTLRATVVDTDGGPDDVVAQLLAEWTADDGGNEVCYRGGRRYRPHLAALDLPAARPVLDAGKTYVVTGGTGGIGSEIARHLCRRGARRLALLGLRTVRARSQWDQPGLTAHEASVIAQVRELEELGARVAVYTGKLTDRARLSGFLADVRASLGEIGGVVHCAGRMAPAGPFTGKDPGDVDAVLEPKVDGVRALAEACLPGRPSFFVLFSSVAAVVPRLAVGVVEYAAANAFLDFYAGYHARTGHPEMRSVAWPSWGNAGMTEEIGVDVGLAALGVDEGLRILDDVMTSRMPASVIVMPAARSDLDPQALLAPPPTGAGHGPSAGQAGPAGPALGPSPPRLAPHAREQVPGWLAGLFAETLGIPASELDPAASFDDLGVESVLMAELVTRIEARAGCYVEPSIMLDHPTLEQLARYLQARLHPGAAPRPAGYAGPGEHTRQLSSEPATTRGTASEAAGHRVAVVGLACRLPGAPDAATFWANLRAGRCAITEVPAARWDAAALYLPTTEVGKSISKWGGFVTGIEEFDPGYFGLTDQEATCLDPAIRLVLEGAATCACDAGYTDGELDGRDVGVFIGARMSGYRHRVGIRAGRASFGADQNFIAARVAQQLNLTGPNLVVDSACSSALVAVQLAVRSLLAGESEMALAGGVDVLLDERPYLEFSALQALSPSGRCRAFDRAADGFVPGEGCGVLLLKRLDRALTDGDRIHAVIDAVAVGNDGRTMGLTTPNPVAQAAVVRRALRESGWAAEDVGMVEAHGTGTMIGDPIELQALTNVFRETSDRTGWCAIGSVKSNIGHLLSAAGITGLLKVVLALEHGEIPPTLFCETPNPRFDFASSPFFPNTGLRPWPERGPRVAGVSAFGLGGTNAHLIASAPAPAHGAVHRQALPAPSFRRRRLWLDGPGAAEPLEPSGIAGITASLLTLHFDDDTVSAAKED